MGNQHDGATQSQVTFGAPTLPSYQKSSPWGRQRQAESQVSYTTRREQDYTSVSSVDHVGRHTQIRGVGRVKSSHSSVEVCETFIPRADVERIACHVECGEYNEPTHTACAADSRVGSANGEVG